MISKKFNLISEDYKKAFLNFLGYTVPQFTLTFLLQIQMGIEPQIAFKTACGVLLGIVIDLIKKYVNVTKY